MDGQFHKRKSTRLFNWLGLVSGLFLAAFLSFLFLREGFSGASLDDVLLLIFFVCFGLGVGVWCAVQLHVQRKAFIHLDETAIEAYCQIGGALRCPMRAVRQADCGGEGLSITLTSGKTYALGELENASALCRYIRKHQAPGLEAAEDAEGEQAQRARIEALRQQRKRLGRVLILCFLSLIPLILLTVVLTDSKELHDFDARDWLVFAVGFAVFAGISLVISRSLVRFLKSTEELAHREGALCRLLLKNAPVPPGKLVRLTLDDEHMPTSRTLIYAFPQGGGWYCRIEGVEDRQLALLYESPVFPSEADLTAFLNDLASPS